MTVKELTEIAKKLDHGIGYEYTTEEFVEKSCLSNLLLIALQKAVDVLIEIDELLFDLPSGINENADPNALSGIDDMTAHIGGIAHQKIKQFLSKDLEVK